MLFRQYIQSLSISQSYDIARRYFVVNSFDGALTMLGLLSGFYVSEAVELSVVIPACLGAAIALGMSGVTSAYLSEKAERKKEFKQLQEAMVSDLSGSTHDKATRWVPIWVALINGLSPLLMSLLIIAPLWLAQIGMELPLDPFELAICVAFLLVFLLGVFLGKISDTFWLISGVQALIVATITAFLIYLVA